MTRIRWDDRKGRSVINMPPNHLIEFCFESFLPLFAGQFTRCQLRKCNAENAACSLLSFLGMQMENGRTGTISKPGDDLHPQDADRHSGYLSLEIFRAIVDISLTLSPHLLHSGSLVRSVPLMGSTPSGVPSVLLSFGFNPFPRASRANLVACLRASAISFRV